MADYVQPGAVTRRVRFFDGQFLVDQDFIDEQKYHLDRERRLGKVLRITGIVDGLAVTSGQANTVRVSAGTAIDGDGRQVVLAQDRAVDLPAAMFNDKQGIKLQILYREQETELATTGSKSERRWLEEPQVMAVMTDGQSTEKPWKDGLPPVVLAQLRLDNKGTVAIDGSVAQHAGLRVPGSVGIGSPGPGPHRLSVNGRTRLGGVADYQADAVLSVAPGTVHFDAPNQVGGRLIIDGSTGNVGIGLGAAIPPRTGLDTGKSVMSGAANDYVKAQFTLSGGGIVTWGGPNARLKWTNRFLAISMERGPVFSDGHLSIHQPTSAIPAANVYDNAARTADAEGVLLKDWEALYAVHTVGGNSVAVSSFQICRYTHAHTAPSNWILIAVVNADDRTVKLGTGVILSAKSSSSRGSPLPTGTILMWSGAANALPEGFALCNGADGTPDLRSRFIVGAGAGGKPEYTPGNSGEPDQHNHRIAIPNTQLATASAGDHNHAPPAQWYERSFLQGDHWTSIDRNGGLVRDARTSTNGNHAHSLAVNIGAFDSAAPVEQNNRPKWYALCFIMKV